MKTGVYPGSFSPPTLAHLAIATAARDQHHLDEVVMVVSRTALAKESVQLPTLDDRLEVLERCVAEVAWLRVELTEDQLLADISADHDVLIMGADKWGQIQELHWYQSEDHRIEALASLPQLAVAPRSLDSTSQVPSEIPAADKLVVDQAAIDRISSSAARAGAWHMMLPEALEFSHQSGAWVDDARYKRWLADAEAQHN